jgi:hypothetical protein
MLCIPGLSCKREPSSHATVSDIELVDPPPSPSCLLCLLLSRSLLEAIPVDVPKVAEQARNAKAMLEDARRVVLDVLARDITKMYSAYCSGPASAYAELAKCWVPLQRVGQPHVLNTCSTTTL